MDGKGRCHDNIFVERLWRTVKYEEVYLHAYQDLVEARAQLRRYFGFYNDERPHQGVGGSSSSLLCIAGAAARCRRKRP
jgi:putative transposase